MLSIKNLTAIGGAGVNQIKLKELLSLRNEIGQSNFIKTMFPPVEIGSITLVDQIVLLALAQLCQPKVIVEVGTYLGFTASLLAMNTSAKIFSIDLPQSAEIDNLSVEQNSILVDGNENDNFLRKKQASDGETYILELRDEERGKITLIKKDSTALDFVEEFKGAEFVFIDGGHERSIVEKDTENARSIVTEGVIVWHDYGSGIHNDVTAFLDSETERKIFHVQGSLCAFEIVG